jgi:5-methylcytosine-specific restriction endonuclease McrA
MTTEPKAFSRRDERRSAEADAYRRLYKTARWRGLRSSQLNRRPLCQPCEKAGRLEAASVVNHRIPHRGDERLFFDAGNLESMCKVCHDGPTQRAEIAGFSGEVDAGGWPTDPKHRSNRSAA